MRTQRYRPPGTGYGTGDEAIHTNGSLRYRGPVVVPQLVELRDEILREFHCSQFYSASRWHEDV